MPAMLAEMVKRISSPVCVRSLSPSVSAIGLQTAHTASENCPQQTGGYSVYTISTKPLLCIKRWSHSCSLAKKSKRSMTGADSGSTVEDAVLWAYSCPYSLKAIEERGRTWCSARS